MTRPHQAHSNGLAAAIARSTLALTRREVGGAKRGLAVFLTTGTSCCFALSGGSISIVTFRCAIYALRASSIRCRPHAGPST